MRQRGAGVRDIKSSNFGFTFGAAPLQPRSSSKQAPEAFQAQKSSRKTPVGVRSAGRSGTVRPPASKAKSSSSSRQASKTPNTTVPRRFVTTTVTRNSRHRDTSDKENESLEDELEADDRTYRPSSRRKSVSATIRLPTTPGPSQTVIESIEEPHQDGLYDELSGLHEDNEKDDAFKDIESGVRRLSWASTARATARAKPVDSSCEHSGALGPAARASSSSTVAPHSFKHQAEDGRRSSHVAPEYSKASAPATKAVDFQSTSHVTKAPSTRRTESAAIVGNSPSISRTTRAHPRTEEISDEGDEESISSKTTPAKNNHVENDLGENQLIHTSSQRQLRQRMESPRRRAHGSAKQTELSTSGGAESHYTTPSASVNKRREPMEREDQSQAAGIQDAVPRKKRRKADPSGTVPITIHRLTSGTSVARYRAQKSCNAVDVLSQITTEIVSRAAIMCSSQHTVLLDGKKPDKEKASRKRKRLAITRFARTLEDNLFEISELVDYAAVLAGRVKGASRDVQIKWEELLSLRREREEIKKEIDDVRMVSRATKEEAEQTRILNEALMDIEIAVVRGRASELAVPDEEKASQPSTTTKLKQVVERGLCGSGLSHMRTGQTVNAAQKGFSTD